MSALGANLALLSVMINEGQTHLPGEALPWIRVGKIAEELGEVMEALVGYTGSNPRKGFTHDLEDVKKELLDVAVTALSAWESLDGNRGSSINALDTHTDYLVRRLQQATSSSSS